MIARHFPSAEVFLFALLLLREPTRSIVVPKGQIQPQKNLPQRSVRSSIRKEKSIPGSTARVVMEVVKVSKGSTLKRFRGWRSPLRGDGADQRI